MEKRSKGFTLAELLIVVAIMAILVAISIPVFTAQKRKAIISVNKANVRSAKAAAAMELLDGSATTAYRGDTEYKTAYFRYDVKQGKIVQTHLGKEKNKGQGDGDLYTTGNTWANNVCKDLKPYEIWPEIIVYVGNPEYTSGNLGKGAPVQTAPYYTEDNQIGKNGTNWFGPLPGSSQ